MSDLIAAAELQIAEAFLEGGYFKEAEAEYARFTHNFPDHPLVIYAEVRRRGAARGERVIIESFATDETTEELSLEALMAEFSDEGAI